MWNPVEAAAWAGGPTKLDLPGSQRPMLVGQLSVKTSVCDGCLQRGAVGGEKKMRNDGGMTGVRGGECVLERGARAGSPPLRKDITLFAPIVPHYARDSQYVLARRT